MHPALSRLNSTPASAATDSAVAPALATLHPLEDLAVVQAEGAEAVTFLQGQLTNDIAGAVGFTSTVAVSKGTDRHANGGPGSRAAVSAKVHISRILRRASAKSFVCKLFTVSLPFLRATK